MSGRWRIALHEWCLFDEISRIRWLLFIFIFFIYFVIASNSIAVRGVSLNWRSATMPRLVFGTVRHLIWSVPRITVNLRRRRLVCKFRPRWTRTWDSRMECVYHAHPWYYSASCYRIRIRVTLRIRVGVNWDEFWGGGKIDVEFGWHTTLTKLTILISQANLLGSESAKNVASFPARLHCCRVSNI